MNAATRGLRVLREEGPASFVLKFVGFVYKITLRKLLPKTHFRTDNGVRVERVPFLDQYLSSFLPGVRVISPDREAGIVSAHEELARPGDSVVIVGGGKGITAVRVADIVGTSGRVKVYEGGREAFEKLRDIVRWNGIENRCEIVHAVVGEERDVYGGDVTGADRVSPEGLPRCDVLELDCEGSEVDILRHLEIEPRVLIVELHPYNFSESPSEVMDLLAEKNYDVERYLSHDGGALSRDEFSTLLEHSDRRGDELVDRPITSNRGQDLVESGARWPVVVAAVRGPAGSE